MAPGSTLLDMPCGTGKLGAALCGYPVKIVAADLSLQMMVLASAEYSPGKLLGFMRFDARNIPLGAGSIDHIVCLRLFHRLPYDVRAKVLKEFRRIVKSSLIVSYSYISPFQTLRNSIRRLYDREKQSFYHETIANIESELRETGFSPLKLRHVLFGASSEIVILSEAV
jgi:ubiquinone/menaquinone biosynthesis C-methylase UbiE